MKKLKITLEIKSEQKNERRVSKLEKLVNAFVRFWKATLASDLRPSSKIKLLQQIFIFSTLLALAYLVFCMLTLILNRL